MRSIPAPGLAPGIPTLGLGTWRLGESASRRAAEVGALRDAIALGYRHFDSAEMYGEGGAERVLGEALRGAIGAREVRRDELFVVSKAYPHHAGRRDARSACERSLARLGLEAIDLYLLHWRGAVPLAETVEAFEALRAEGHIRAWGVSNFDRTDLEELAALPGGERCAVNQVWYSAAQRGVEFELLPWMRARGMALVAYSPIDQAALARNARLEAMARRCGLDAAQLALAWVLHQAGVAAIPKSTDPAHLRANLAAQAIALDAETLAGVDRLFPPPQRPMPLAMN